MPERFSGIRLLDESGGGSQRVSVEVGMEGFNILGENGRTLRKYPLHHISRWSMRGTSLILFTKSSVDIEDRTVTLQGSEHTIRSVLDMLTCSCMQMAELLQSGQVGAGGTSNAAAATSINALLKKSKKPTLLTADQVEFWHHPEKEGYMYSQGEHIKTWRKRWFILKQGFLFRFADNNVNSASKPRGLVDLTTVTDVTDGSSTTGRPNSIRLSTATGGSCYLAENETAQVEWISALEGTVARLVRSIAGVDEEEQHATKPSNLADQLMRSYNVASGGGGGGSGRPTSSGKHHSGSSSHHRGSSSHRSSGNGMIRIVNYEPSSSGGGGHSGGGYGGGGSRTGGDGGSGYVNIDYGSVAGAQQLPPQNELPPSGGGGAYGGYSGGGGGFYPSVGAQQQQPMNPYQQQQQQQPSYGQPQQQMPGSSMYGQPQQQPMQAAPVDAGNSGYYQQQPQYQQQQPMDPYDGAQQQQQQPNVSLFDAVTAPPPAAPVQTSPWQVHYTAEGRPYYYNSSSGITSWEAPTQ